MLDRTTIYRLKKDFKLLGINYKNPSEDITDTLNIIKDYPFDLFNSEGRLIQHASGFHTYNMYITNTRFNSNPTYC